MIRQFLPRFRVEAWAIRPADRLERQCKHHRIPYDGFKIHVIVLNREVESFIRRIREKLLEFDLERNAHRVEAPHTLSGRDRRDLGRHQDALVQALEAHVDGEVGTFRDDGGTGSQLLGGGHVDGALPHLTGAVDEVAHVQVEGRSCSRHEG